jgi:NitT/TauT family transport system ATP-binding protein
MAPGLPVERAAAAEISSEFVEPLPDVPVQEIVSLVEYLRQRGGEAEVYRIADETSHEFGRVIATVKAAEMLDLVETPGQLVVLTPVGRRFAEAPPDERVAEWRERLLTLRLFRDLHDALRRQPDHTIDRDFVLETIVTRMPYENYEKVFNTLVRWARFGELFTYNEATQRIVLATPP